MAGRIIAQLIIAGSGIVVRAFAEAYRQAAANAARHAANPNAARSGAQTAAGAASAAFSKTGMTVAEAKQILNLSEDATREQIVKNYEHLFKVNEKGTGGSFYLQSKVVRAKETLEYELQQMLKQKSAAETASSKTPSEKP